MNTTGGCLQFAAVTDDHRLHRPAATPDWHVLQPVHLRWHGWQRGEGSVWGGCVGGWGERKTGECAGEGLRHAVCSELHAGCARQRKARQATSSWGGWQLPRGHHASPPIKNDVPKASLGHSRLCWPPHQIHALEHAAKHHVAPVEPAGSGERPGQGRARTAWGTGPGRTYNIEHLCPLMLATTRRPCASGCVCCTARDAPVLTMGYQP